MTSDPRPLHDPALRALTIGTDATVREAMEAIDAGALEIALVAEADDRLVGTVSDGDIRRALLRGARLEDRVRGCMSTAPHVVHEGASRAEVLDLMRARSLAQIPVVDGSGRLRGLHSLREVLGAAERPNAAVIMAGGKGTRLGELTRTVPKPMLPVAGRPILEHLVLHLVGSGVRRVLLSVAYLAEQIEDHFGDGSAFGCSIGYLREEPDRPLGTGGALALVEQEDRERGPLLVLNGDLVTRFSVDGLLDAHQASGAAATVALRRYAHEVPFGVLEVEDDRLLRIIEKPAVTWPVNAGIYMLEPRLLARVPTGCPYPLPSLIEDCVGRGEPVGVWESTDDWQDVGRPAELRSARGEQ